MQLLSSLAKLYFYPDSCHSIVGTRTGYPQIRRYTTFVDKERYRGTCYKAANWSYVGETQGRGKWDRLNEYKLPVKSIYLYPLHKNFRQILAGSD
nr:Druantia anti-phage system protein DruA [Acididesulfobacillus acetoxydans]